MNKCDLRDGDKLTLSTGQIIYVGCACESYRVDDYKNNLIAKRGCAHDIVKVERIQVDYDRYYGLITSNAIEYGKVAINTHLTYQTIWERDTTYDISYEEYFKEHPKKIEPLKINNPLSFKDIEIAKKINEIVEVMNERNKK